MIYVDIVYISQLPQREKLSSDFKIGRDLTKDKNPSKIGIQNFTFTLAISASQEHFTCSSVLMALLDLLT